MTTRGVALLCGIVCSIAACNSRSEDSGQEVATDKPQPAAPSDTLVATAPGGVEIWFTLAREGTAADGSHCTDRTMEIRRDTSRIRIPLLYTGQVPELVNDSTIRARLSNQCVPGDPYLVNLRTGHPVPER